MCIGLRVLESNLWYNGPVSYTHLGLKEVIESLYVFLISIGKGLVLAGDGGTKITCDIATGFGGVALALASIQNNKIEFLPSID